MLVMLHMALGVAMVSCVMPTRPQMLQGKRCNMPPARLRGRMKRERDWCAAGRATKKHRSTSSGEGGDGMVGDSDSPVSPAYDRFLIKTPLS
jgi:hypothetical protein